MTRQILIGTLGLSALVLAAPAFGQYRPNVPVVVKRMVDAGKPGDIIMVGAQVTLPQRGPDGFVSVRAAPRADAPELDRLKNGIYVITMGAAKDWQPVIYFDPAQTTDDMEKACGLPNPAPAGLPVTSPYGGPCRSGYISRKFLTILAD